MQEVCLFSHLIITLSVKTTHIIRQVSQAKLKKVELLTNHELHKLHELTGTLLSS